MYRFDRQTALLIICKKKMRQKKANAEGLTSPPFLDTFLQLSLHKKIQDKQWKKVNKSRSDCWQYSHCC